MNDSHDIAFSALTEFLTTAEVGARLRWSTREMRRRIASGFFLEGREFVRPGGCQPRWIWSRVVARMTERDVVAPLQVLARSGGRKLL